MTKDGILSKEKLIEKLKTVIKNATDVSNTFFKPKS
jgi:hypothetical protein